MLMSELTSKIALVEGKIKNLLQKPPSRTNSPPMIQFLSHVHNMNMNGGDETPKFHLPRDSVNRKSLFVKSGSARSLSHQDETFGSPAAHR